MPSETSHSSNPSIEELLEQFASASMRKRRSLMSSLESRVEEISQLGDKSLDLYDPKGDDWAAGWILQLVKKYFPDSLKNFFEKKQNGWFDAPSSLEIDYGILQENLLEESFQEADSFTSAMLRKLAGPEAESRGYVYFSEVNSIPSIDLLTIDRLWIAYSQGRFGFSRQASLLKALEGRYDRLWQRIGWKQDGIWTRYPGSFDWSINAPEGHMPLINQLRGVRLMDALLNHPSLSGRF